MHTLSHTHTTRTRRIQKKKPRTKTPSTLTRSKEKEPFSPTQRTVTAQGENRGKDIKEEKRERERRKDTRTAKKKKKELFVLFCLLSLCARHIKKGPFCHEGLPGWIQRTGTGSGERESVVSGFLFLFHQISFCKSTNNKQARTRQKSAIQGVE